MEFEKYCKKLEPKMHINSAVNDKDKVKWEWKGALKWGKDQLRNGINGYFKIINESEKS